jgi:hypothetical protein
MGLRVLTLGGILIAAAHNAAASQFVLVMHDASGWQFQSAEKLTIDGKNKLRIGSTAAEISQDAMKRLPESVIGTVPLRLHHGGYLAVRNGAAWVPVYPDGASFKGASSAQALWTAAQVVIQADKASKDQAMRTSDIFAILPGTAAPAETVVAFLADEANFRGAGEASPAESFDERMSFLVGIAGTATGAAQAKLRSILSDGMTSALQRADSAAAGRFAALNEGLRYVPVSEKAFPSDPALTQLCAALRDKLTWLNRRMAIVRALGAAAEWDALIDKYGDKAGDLGDYDDAFPELHQLHDRSSKESETFHAGEARRLYTMTPKQCVPAQEQVKLAMLRDANSSDLKALSDEIRLGCIGGPKPPVAGPPETPGQTAQITGYLTTADRSMADGKFDDAENAIKRAEIIFAGDPRIVLTRAKLLRARRNFRQAIDVLDRYDSLVAADAPSMEVSATLRANIEYDISSGRDAARLATTKAEAEGDYPAAFAKAVDGVNLDPADPELLYHAGLDAALTRNVSDARKYWQSYLAVTQSQSSENKRRTDVRSWLPDLGAATPPAGTAPNWFSGAGNPQGLMYDPVSLTVNAHPFEVRGSRKQTTLFDWQSGVLTAIRTTTQEPGAVPVNVYFDYYPAGKGARRASTDIFADKGDPGTPKLTPAGAVGSGKGVWVALFNYPAVNPYLVEKFTGKRVATILAGNPYFNPYEWNGVYAFLAEYDADGRVKSAAPLQAGTKPLDFQWDGNKLLAIVERGGDYRRDLKYDGARLTEEIVTFRGKSSKISYKYNGGRLAEADCDSDFSLDGRSRHVAFGN